MRDESIRKIESVLDPGEISRLQTRLRLADRYAAYLNRTLDNVIEEWPESVKELDPGPEDPEAREQWVDTRCPAREGY